MGLEYGCIVPHSPNLVPAVSRRADEASRTRQGMEELGMILGVRKPRTCVIVSPHSPFLAEAFGVWDAGILKGSMARFQAPDVHLQIEVDSELAAAICDVCKRMDLPVGTLDPGWELDRGVTVPGLYLFSDDIKVVPVSTSMLDWDGHWLFGTAIAKAAELTGADVAIVASSNLSHRVTPDAPHGYSSKGRDFDERIQSAVTSGRLREFLEIPHETVREASECGFIPMLVLGGAFDGRTIAGRVLSYEVPFGIGYMVAEVFTAEGHERPLRRMVSTALRRPQERTRLATGVRTR